MWLVGEHDLATVGLIDSALVEVMAIDTLDDVAVDLSEAAFIDASTLGALVRGRRLLTGSGRRLTLRSPRRFPRRVLELCGLADLIEAAPPSVTPQDPGATTALGTWIEVPSSARQAEASPPAERDAAPGDLEVSADERAVDRERLGSSDRSGSAGPVGR